MRRDSLIAAVLLLLTFAAFARVTRCDFVSYDDQLYVTDNPIVRAGLSLQGLHWALTTDHTGYWHPLTWLSLMLDASLFGADNAAGFHLTNLALHALNVLLVLALFRALTGDALRSAIVAALWAVHPLRTESVAWVAERKDVLTASLGLLTLLAYVAYARRPSLGRYLGVALLFALTLAAKPMLVTLPCLMLLFDYWPLRRLNLGNLPPPPTSNSLPASPPPLTRVNLEKIPLLALSATIAYATVVAQTASNSMADLDQVPLLHRLAYASLAYATYLLNHVRFENLAVLYPLPRTIPLVPTFTAVAIILAASIVALARARAWPWLAVGWFWFVGTLLPTSGLFQSGEQALADRYAYFPSLGLFLAVGWAIPAAWFHRRVARLVGLVSLALVLVVLTGFTHRQVGFWSDSESLFARSLAVTAGHARAHVGLAQALRLRGDIDGAADQLQKALLLRPRDAQTLNNLANLVALRGQYDRAIALLGEALAIDPRYAQAWSNLGNMLLAKGDNAAAAERFRSAIAIDPHMYVAHHNLGLALARQHQPQLALDAFTAALDLRANLVPSLIGQGDALLALDRPAQAADAFRRALAADAQSLPGTLGLAGAMEKLARPAEAAKLYQQALRLAVAAGAPSAAQTARDAIQRLSAPHMPQSQPSPSPASAPR